MLNAKQQKGIAYRHKRMRNMLRDFLKTPQGDWYKDKLTRQDHFDALAHIDDALNRVHIEFTNEERCWFMVSCFGHFLTMHREMNFSGGVIHRLLLRELHHKGPTDEMQFMLGNQSVRFSRADEVSLEEIRGVVTAGEFREAYDVVKLCHIYMLKWILMGVDERFKIQFGSFGWLRISMRSTCSRGVPTCTGIPFTHSSIRLMGTETGQAMPAGKWCSRTYGGDLQHIQSISRLIGSSSTKFLLPPMPKEYDSAPGITHVVVLSKSSRVTLTRTSEVPSISSALELNLCTRLTRPFVWTDLIVSVVVLPTIHLNLTTDDIVELRSQYISMVGYFRWDTTHVIPTFDPTSFCQQLVASA
ncbi:hypothetical protein Ddye_008431 [Dipteronia dyeriana]|uniref:Uncharacterized protein n=1 Tax=Dipteronia dyeriana TaxID=168575 RepID=A0AAD9X9N6_9ROSI|nr:hypothetical protein Ddye_008431 [Dipteronia dyeriana]